MKFYNVGKALYDYRVYYKLSQNQLCKGICSASTLSRIESGEREIDSLLAETLFSRLGKTTAFFECIWNEKDYWLREMRNQIEDSIRQKQVDQAESLINQYENFMPKKQVLHKQVLFFYKAMLLKLKNGIQKEICLRLRQAIDLTRPDYGEYSSKKLYSSIEVRIIYELLFYEKIKECLLRFLIQFMEHYYDFEEKEKSMVPFLHYLSLQYEREHKYKEMIQIAQQAINILSEGKHYSYIADFYFQKLRGEEKIYGLSNLYRNRKKELIEECHHVFYMYMIDGKNEKMRQMERFCKEKLKCQITR